MLRLPPCFAIHVETVHPHINELFIIIVDVNAKNKVKLPPNCLTLNVTDTIVKLHRCLMIHVTQE